jgi:hypothetical protein
MVAAIGCGSGGGGATGGAGGGAGKGAAGAGAAGTTGGAGAGAAGTTGAAGGAGHGAAGATGAAGAGAAGTSGAAGAGAAGASGAAGGAGHGAAGASGAAGGAGSGAGGAAAGGAAGGGSAGTTGNGGASGAAGGFLSTLLVDNDYSDNNDPTNTSPVASTSDTAFATLFNGEGLVHSVFAVPSNTSVGPNYAQLTGVSTIIWYTGDAYGSEPTITNAQQTTLKNWLDLGGKTLIFFSQNLIYDLGLGWTDTGTGTFASTYLGLAGGVADVTMADGTSLADINYTATGNTTVTAFNGLAFDIDGDTPSGFNTTADAVNPATGTDVLLTVAADPAATGTDSPTAVASGYTKGTSKIVYVGIPIESIHGAPTSTSAQLFHAVLKYTGLK